MNTVDDVFSFIKTITVSDIQKKEDKFGQKIKILIPAPWGVDDDLVREYADKFRATKLPLKEFVLKSGYSEFEVLIIGENPPNQQWWYKI